MTLLSQIDSPADIRKLRLTELPILAQEAREFIIQTVSETGGHLAPSLGVVDLTIALLYTHRLPRDKIIWDVGHQAYAFKLLTGRRDQLSTIRQFEGLSGFLKRNESEYDVWGAGHASTSISAALGFAAARDRNRQAHNVVAVIGDGSLSGGLAFEGLNNAGASGSEIMVVLNDNAMSISPNVGALANYLTEAVASPIYQKMKADIWNLAGKAGSFGSHFRLLARRLEDSLKNLVVPGMLFEQLGFEYYGPIDGHDIFSLVSIMRELRNVNKPKLLHVITKKGKGYIPAERDSTTFHGVSRFDKTSGVFEKCEGTKSYTEFFGDAMCELGKTFPDLSAITAAMETGTGLTKFHHIYASRFFDVGIAEGHAVIFGAAMASEKIHTVVAIYSSFLQRAYDMLIHDVALQNIPLVFAIDRAGLVGEDGPTHHGIFDIAFLRHIPNMVVCAPRDETQLRNLLFTALSRFSEPWAIRFPRAQATGCQTGAFELIEIGTWEKVHTGDGRNVFLCVGTTVGAAQVAAQKLETEHNISVDIIDCRFIKPLDEKMLSDIFTRAERIFTFEEGCKAGGFGESILSFAASRGFGHIPIIIHAIEDHFIQHGARKRLLEIVKLDSTGIFDTFLSAPACGACPSVATPARGACVSVATPPYL